MSSEKFSLKWNDFQATVSQSLGLLRAEEDLFDVTLVSDDQRQVSAHKLVLSACSSFFKNIFKKNSHSHPLLYLGGVSFDNLEFILDYIYQGEVLIFQEQLDGFLDTAKKLNITGLIGDDDEPTFRGPKQQHFETKPDLYQLDQDHVVQSQQVEKAEDSNIKSRIVERIEFSDPTDINEKIKELTEKVDGGFLCKSCGKITRDDRNHRRHVETHIEGLSYPCPFCDKLLRNSDSKRKHIQYNHKIRHN